MENIFRYERQRLYADVSVDMLPKAISVIKDYLASRLYSEEERQENPVDFIDRTLKSMPSFLAQQVNLVKLLLTKRDIVMQQHERALQEIAAIPECGAYQRAINITRGYRPGNVAEIKIEADKTAKDHTESYAEDHIELYFSSQCGDETRPLRWMQYDALLAKAREAGFGIDRGKIDQEVDAFKADDSSYFRKAPINEVMSAFDWSELEAVVKFLWSENLPEDMKIKLGQKV